MNRVFESLNAIDKRLPDAPSPEDDEDSPVFIFACCWRSGSTLLQRLCMNNKLIFGEPYGQVWLVENLLTSLRTFSPSWPPPGYLAADRQDQDSETESVANSYPPLSSLKSAYRSFFDELLRRPANKTHQGWGAKFVRGTSEHAALLRWLYPNAKLLFLIRNPYDCIRSWNVWDKTGVVAYDRWPDVPLTASHIAKVWHRNTMSFLEDYLRLDAHLIRYDELCEANFDSIEKYLGFELERDALSLRLTMRADVDPVSIPIHDIDLMEVESIVEPLASELGYAPSLSGSPDTKTVPQTRVSVPSQDRGKVVVLVPVGSHIEPACEAGLRQLEESGYEVRRVRGFSAIDQARNVIAAEAIRDGFEKLMWIDSDVGFSADDVERLCMHDIPIACGIYPKKNRRELACHVLPGSQAIVFGKEGSLTEIAYAGAGFLLIDREVFLTLQRQLDLPVCNEYFGKPIVPYFQPMIKQIDGKRWYLAEDYAFCERAKSCGYKVIADTTIRLRHVGSYEYTWEDAGTSPQKFETFKLNLRPPQD